MELADESSVDRCVSRLNGKLVPGSNPVSSVVYFQNTTQIFFFINKISTSLFFPPPEIYF